MQRLRGWLRTADAHLEHLAIVLLAAMALVVTGRVVARVVFDAPPAWMQTGRWSIILITWVVSLGAAIGFRERSHAAVSMITAKLPEGARRPVEWLNAALVFAFGVYLIVGGVWLVLRPGDGAPYVLMPVSGVMICVYTLLQAAGVHTERSPVEWPDEAAVEGLPHDQEHGE